jgi:hypothetical protein
MNATKHGERSAEATAQRRELAEALAVLRAMGVSVAGAVV